MQSFWEPDVQQLPKLACTCTGPSVGINVSVRVQNRERIKEQIKIDMPKHDFLKVVRSIMP